MEYAHRRRAYLEWLEDEPGARSVLIDKPREGPIAAVISARMDLYAPDEVRLVWAGLVSSVDRLRWLIEVGGAYVDPAATAASKEDKEIAAVYHSIDELTEVVRRASAMR